MDIVSINIKVSEVSLYGKSWRVISKSIITRKIMEIPIAMGAFLMLVVIANEFNFSPTVPNYDMEIEYIISFSILLI
jgi:hypothetical protein